MTHSDSSTFSVAAATEDVAEGGGSFDPLLAEAKPIDLNDNRLARPSPSAANPDWCRPEGIERPDSGSSLQDCDGER